MLLSNTQRHTASWAAPGVFPCMPWNIQDFTNKYKYIYMYTLVYLLHVANLIDWPKAQQKAANSPPNKKGSHLFLAAAPNSHRIVSLRNSASAHRNNSQPANPSFLAPATGGRRPATLRRPPRVRDGHGSASTSNLLLGASRQGEHTTTLAQQCQIHSSEFGI